MELAKLIFKNLGRHKLRSFLTVLGIAIAVLAFSLIRTVITAWYSGVEASSPNRMITRNAVSLIFDLPLSYKREIESIPGVKNVTYANWFGGIYIDAKHSQFPQIAVDADSWFEVYPEYLVSEREQKIFLRERNAVIVGVKLAERFGWQEGDTIRLSGLIYPGDWDFVIRGIYTGAKRSTDETMFLFHWRYLDERLKQFQPWRAGHVGWYVVGIADPDQAGLVSRSLDERFKNSLAETLTESEQAFVQGFISMSEAILTALRSISAVIVGVILAVLSNTMAMTARERLSEYAVLKTLGFRARHLVSLIAGESLLIGVLGGVLGISLAYPAAAVFDNILSSLAGVIFPAFEVVPLTVFLCAMMALGAGIAAAIFPAWRAATLGIAQGLRRVG